MFSRDFARDLFVKRAWIASSDRSPTSLTRQAWMTLQKGFNNNLMIIASDSIERLWMAEKFRQIQIKSRLLNILVGNL